MSQQGFQLRSTEDLFYELCKQNSNLRLERTARGEVIIMPVSTENPIQPLDSCAYETYSLIPLTVPYPNFVNHSSELLDSMNS